MFSIFKKKPSPKTPDVNEEISLRFFTKEGFEFINITDTQLKQTAMFKADTLYNLPDGAVMIVRKISSSAVILGLLLILSGCAETGQTYPCTDTQKAMDTIVNLYAINNGYMVSGGCE